MLLSFLVIMAWTVFFAPPPAEEGVGGAAVSMGAAPADHSEPGRMGAIPAPPAKPALGALVTATEERQLVLELGEPGEAGHYRAVFTNRGARLTRLSLGDYYRSEGLDEVQRRDPSNWVDLLVPIATPEGTTGSLALAASQSSAALLRGTPLTEALWVGEVLEEQGQTVGVRFSYAPGSGVTFTKTVRWLTGTHQFDVTLALANDALQASGERQFTFTPGLCVPPAGQERFYQEPRAGAAWRDRNDEAAWSDVPAKPDGGRDRGGSLPGSGQFSFAGVHNKYFALFLRPHPDDELSGPSIRGASYRRIRDAEFAAQHPAEADASWRFLACDLAVVLDLGEIGQTTTRRYRVFAGPKDRDELVEVWPDHRALIEEELGFFSGIARGILGILGFYQGLVGNWGWAIILMTFTVRLLLFPINRRSQTAMARHATKMKRVQPRLNAIKEKHAKNPKRLREEQAKVFQEEGLVPPLGGCLPMFLQFPVFIGLFQALRVDFHLRQAPFMGWINDLSKPDRLLTLDLDTHLPFIGVIEHLNVLPILMVVLMIVQFRSMPTPTDEQQARMQKMMQWMPIVFGFLLYNYAAGLSLYMITSSTLGLVETKGIKRIWPIDDRELPKKKSGFMARLAEMQKDQARKLEQAQRRKAGAGGAKGKRRAGSKGR
jgi:YidC/Oxa1 family membrane protein insertase